MTHRDLCRVAARVLLNARWCFAATYELQAAGGQVDVLGVSGIADPDVEAAFEAERTRQREAWMAATTRKGRGRYPHGLIEGFGARRGSGRIDVVEVKRTRSDLLADLRVGKLLRYEPIATHCWLAGPRDLILGDLPGLPDHWGLLELGRDANHSGAHRPARRLRVAPDPERRLWIERIARSLAYRATGDGRLAAEIEPDLPFAVGKP